MPSVFVGIGPGQDAVEWAAQEAAAQTEDDNRVSLTALATAALAANPNDVAQDAAIATSAAGIITQANAIAANPGTTAATIAASVVKLAQGITLLAQGLTIVANNDVNTKKELNALIRLATGALDTTGQAT
jgi:hypothetical protein